MARTITLSGLSLVGTDRLLHIVKSGDESTPPSVSTFDLKNYGAKNFLPQHFLKDFLDKTAEVARLCMTADTYAYLRFQSQHFAWPGDGPLVTDDMVSLVFPAQGNKQINIAPNISKEADQISRWAAAYYYQLNHAQVRRWDGMVDSFEHRAANTLSYRSYAPYQNVALAKRKLMGPIDANHEVLQFDWSAAEWNLILNHCGYETPEGSAYSQLAPSGVSHDKAKMIVLPYIYGQGMSGLVERAGESDVNHVIREIERNYPNVLAWREKIMHQSVVDFHGFKIQLGDKAYRRPNHFAQTALQLCKWDLLSRISQIGGHALAVGDMHDQLLWHVDAASEEQGEKAHAIYNEVKKPLFGQYNIPPKMTIDKHWR